MVEILKDNARPEAGEVYTAMDMAWATLVGQIRQARDSRPGSEVGSSYRAAGAGSP